MQEMQQISQFSPEMQQISLQHAADLSRDAACSRSLRNAAEMKDARLERTARGS
jgi:hypothetical protein